MSILLFSNNAQSTLSGAITNTATTISLASGGGALFPNPSAGYYFVATIIDAATGLLNEIIWVTGRSGDTLTVIRAQETTTGLNWLAGDIIGNFWTAGQATAMLQQSQSPNIVNTSLNYYGVDTGVADSMVVTTSPVITSYVDGMMFEITPAATNLTTTPQINICSLGTKTIVHTSGLAAQAGDIQSGQKTEMAYDGTLGKMVLINLPNPATTTNRGIGRSATSTEAKNQATAGSVPAWLTPETLAAALVVYNIKTRLIANTIFYVSTTGNDSNNGLTSGTAWLTLQNAYNQIQNNYDCSGFVAAIQLADGTYGNGLIASGPISGQTGAASIIIQGNLSNSSNVIISTSTNCIMAQYGAEITVQWLKITTTGVNPNGVGLNSQNNSTILFNNIVFGSCGFIQMEAGQSSVIASSGPYSITASSPYHMYANFGGVINTIGAAVTLTGTPAFSSQFAAAIGGVCQSYSMTFSGSATGTRYNATLNGIINTNGSGASYFPGNAAGTTSTGGQYA